MKLKLPRIRISPATVLRLSQAIDNAMPIVFFAILFAVLIACLALIFAGIFYVAMNIPVSTGFVFSLVGMFLLTVMVIVKEWYER